LVNGAIGSGQGFVFNLDKPTWQDKRVRQAINMMVNFEWMNETLFYGLYDRPVSFWDNSDLAATGAPSEGEIAILQPLVDEGLLDAAILTDEAVQPFASTSSERPLDRRMLRAASALLDEAGWVVEDGLRTKDGETLEAVFLQFSPQFDRIVNPIIENLKRLGVDARLDRVDTSQFIERRRSGDFDIVNHSLGQGYEPGSGLRQWFGSETADDSSRNLMRLRSDAVDALLPVVIKIIAQIEGGGDVFEGISGGGSELTETNDSDYAGGRGLPQEFIEELEREFGFDKPPLERFLNMMWNYIRFDFGESYFRSISVVDLVLEKMPVSITLGLWSTLIAYMISIPLGIKKAVTDGSRFDTATSAAIIVAYAIPGFLFAILLIVLFAGGSYYRIFPLRGLTSSNFEELSMIGKVLDYFWHITLPVLASTISAFATLTLLTKNSFLDEIKKQYVITAKAKGLSEKKVLYGLGLRRRLPATTRWCLARFLRSL